MSDNVFILGAGFSHDAGIPLLRNFIDRLWDYRTKGRSGRNKLSEEQINRLDAAVDIINELSSYHKVVRFEDDNIEDVMSMLAFDLMSEKRRAKSKLSAFIKAIVETIEISCKVKHPGVQGINLNWNHDKIRPYNELWNHLFYLREPATLHHISDRTSPMRIPEFRSVSVTSPKLNPLRW